MAFIAYPHLALGCQSSHFGKIPFAIDSNRRCRRGISLACCSRSNSQLMSFHNSMPWDNQSIDQCSDGNYMKPRRHRIHRETWISRRPTTKKWIIEVANSQIFATYDALCNSRIRANAKCVAPAAACRFSCGHLCSHQRKRLIRIRQMPNSTGLMSVQLRFRFSYCVQKQSFDSLFRFRRIIWLMHTSRPDRTTIRAQTVRR